MDCNRSLLEEYGTLVSFVVLVDRRKY
jgi:hypothetical protein